MLYVQSIMFVPEIQKAEERVAAGTALLRSHVKVSSKTWTYPRRSSLVEQSDVEISPTMCTAVRWHSILDYATLSVAVR